MKHRLHVVGLLAVSALIAAGCGSDKKAAAPTTTAATTTTAAAAGGATTTAAGPTTSGAPTTLGGHACDGSLKGKTVTVTSSIRDTEAAKLDASWKPFEDCTGVTVKHTGSATFEDDIKAAVQGGNPSDLTLVPQPGLLATLAKSGKVVERSDLIASVTANNGEASWVGYGTVDGKFYGPPLGANLKSLVWYNPALFKSKGYTAPATFDDLIKLSDKIVADGGKPWCAGISSGNATGWPATDWLEEVVLSNDGPQVYDDWIANKVKFNDPKISKDLDTVGSILKNEKYIYGGVQSIATTAFGDATIANGLIDGKCYMYQMANFFSNNFPAGTTLGPDGQVSTFPFPTINPANKGAVEGGGEFIAAFRDAPEVRAVQDYTTSVDFANRRAALGGWFTSNKNIELSSYADPFEEGLAQQLKSATVFRFDASDLMPSAVGSGAEWKQLTNWITGQSTKDTVDTIQAAWPAS